METKTKYISGFILILATLAGAGINEIVNEDAKLFYCESKDIISDCVNGVKADGQRCYYNASNGRSYSYCSEGWQEYNLFNLKNVETQKSSSKFICDPVGCVAQ